MKSLDNIRAMDDTDACTVYSSDYPAYLSLISNRFEDYFFPFFAKFHGNYMKVNNDSISQDKANNDKKRKLDMNSSNGNGDGVVDGNGDETCIASEDILENEVLEGFPYDEQSRDIDDVVDDTHVSDEDDSVTGDNAPQQARDNVFLKKLETIASLFELNEEVVRQTRANIQNSNEMKKRISLRNVRVHVKGILSWIKVMSLLNVRNDLMSVVCLPVILSWVKSQDKQYHKKYTALSHMLESIKSSEITESKDEATSTLFTSETMIPPSGDGGIRSGRGSPCPMDSDMDVHDGPGLPSLKSSSEKASATSYINSDEVKVVTDICLKYGRVRSRFEKDLFHTFPVSEMNTGQPVDILNTMIADSMILKVDLIPHLYQVLLIGNNPKADNSLINECNIGESVGESINQEFNNERINYSAMCCVFSFVSLVDLKTFVSTDSILDVFSCYLVSLKSQGLDTLEASLRCVFNVTPHMPPSIQKANTVPSKEKPVHDEINNENEMSTSTSTRKSKKNVRIIKPSLEVRKMAERLALKNLLSQGIGTTAPELNDTTTFDSLRESESNELNMHISQQLYRNNKNMNHHDRRRAKISQSSNINYSTEQVFIESAAEVSPEAKLAAIQFLKHPNSIKYANKISKALALKSKGKVCDREYLERLPVSQFQLYFPDSVPAQVLAAHKLSES